MPFPPFTTRQLLIAFGVALYLVLVATVQDAQAASVRQQICQVFGPRCAAALRVVSCETGGRFDRFAVGRAGERGLFQIHPVHFGWLNERRLFEVRYNARAAFRLSHGGRDWSPWTCRP